MEETLSVIEASDVLRAVMLSGLTGFVVFCACYAIAVWRKRNRDRGPRGGLLRLGTLLFLLGSGGVIGCWVANEFSTRDGIVSGEELFVVHAKRDVNIVYLADYAPVSEGQVIAELVPPSMNGQMAVLASRIEEAQARVRALGIKPLAIDPVLLQRQPQLRAQIDQSKQMQFDLRRSRRDFEKEQEALLTAWAREKGQLESELATAKKLFETSTGQIKLAEASLARAQEMLRLYLTSAQVADDRSATILHHTLERDKARVSIESLARRIAILDDHNSRSNLAFSSQCAAIDKDLSQIAASLENLQAQYSQLEKELTEDRTRATSSASLEVEAARYQLSALQAERDKVIAAARITAPFAGQVVYRHPSPGLAEENSPVLALSSGSGFTARVAMPAHEVNQVAKEDSVQFALEQAVLSKFFGGR